VANQVLQRLSSFILLLDEASLALLRLKSLLSGAFSDSHNVDSSLFFSQWRIIDS